MGEIAWEWTAFIRTMQIKQRPDTHKKLIAAAAINAIAAMGKNAWEEVAMAALIWHNAN